MSTIAFIIGLGIPTICGWLLLRLIEYRSPVLGRMERWAAGAVLGPTLMMALVFIIHVTTGLPLHRTAFLGIELATLCVLGGLYLRQPLTSDALTVAHTPRPRWELLVWILLACAIVKVAIAGITFLLLTPTYLDDALDNWNLRGRVFYEDRALTLVMPGEDPVLSPKGVSSYPPTVPLLKASFAAMAGTWSEPLVNVVHVVWFFLAAILLFSAARRYLARHWSLLAAYVYLAMPLATMHGTNPYADVFVSLHVLLAATWTFDALREQDPIRQTSRFWLLGIAFAALSFTKNEGIILYLPPLILILVSACVLRLRARSTDLRTAFLLLARAALPLLLVALPWLLFKWSHGLTFGNAKPFSSFSIYWREYVLSSVVVNTFFEGNWLFLFPLFFGLLAWRWRAAIGRFLPLTAFVLIVYVGQMILFLFTDLAVEALMQTGYARGLIQLLPCIVLLTTVLLADATDDRATG